MTLTTSATLATARRRNNWRRKAYAAMRLVGRSRIVREAAPIIVNAVRNWGRQNTVPNSWDSSPVTCEQVPADLLATLRARGYAPGLALTQAHQNAILLWAQDNPCYADRDPAFSFDLENDGHKYAEEKFKKNILVSQYFNTEKYCPAIAEISHDKILKEFASAYLGAPAKMVGVNLWWTFPTNATKAEKDKHAHLFHRDLDDFRFVKFFFYITDCSDGDGAHVLVDGSHKKDHFKNSLGFSQVTRFEDDAVSARYGRECVVRMSGQAGHGFVEDTWTIHKGSSPQLRPRLILQIQFALNDYGVQHDRRSDLAINEDRNND